MNNKEKDTFEACGTCINYSEINTSIGTFTGCKKHKDYPVNYFKCNMSIVCDDWQNDDSHSFKNISNFRRSK